MEEIIGILLCVNGFLIYQVFRLGAEMKSWNAGQVYYARKIHDLQMELEELKKAEKPESAEEKVLLEINARALKKLYRKEKKNDGKTISIAGRETQGSGM